MMTCRETRRRRLRVDDGARRLSAHQEPPLGSGPESCRGFSAVTDRGVTAAAPAKLAAQAKSAIAMAQAGLSSQGEPGQKPSQEPGKANERNAKGGSGDRKDDRTNVAGAAPGPNQTGSSGFIALPERDRKAIQQTRNEKYADEYGRDIEQYMRNLADQEAK